MVFLKDEVVDFLESRLIFLCGIHGGFGISETRDRTIRRRWMENIEALYPTLFFIILQLQQHCDEILTVMLSALFKILSLHLTVSEGQRKYFSASTVLEYMINFLQQNQLKKWNAHCTHLELEIHGKSLCNWAELSLCLSSTKSCDAEFLINGADIPLEPGKSEHIWWEIGEEESSKYTPQLVQQICEKLADWCLFLPKVRHFPEHPARS